jgi:hypothetical protein
MGALRGSALCPAPWHADDLAVDPGDAHQVASVGGAQGNVTSGTYSDP